MAAEVTDLIQLWITTMELMALLGTREAAEEEDLTKEAFMSDAALMACHKLEDRENLAFRVIARRQATEAMELCLCGLQFIEIKNLISRTKSTGKSQYGRLYRKRMSEGQME